MATGKARKRIHKIKGFFAQVYSFAVLRHTKFNTHWLRKKARELRIARLHVGCGNIYLNDWLNITLENKEEYGRMRLREGALYLNYNLLGDWPFDENSIDYVAASHFIEHLDLNHGMAFTQKCFRVLKSGGVIRLSCPNLELYAKNYVERNKEFFNHPLIREWCAFKNAVTPGEIFAAKAYDSGGSHKWFYDFDSLKHILESAGFVSVRKVSRLEGRTPDLERIEMDKRELETVYVEGLKL